MLSRLIVNGDQVERPDRNGNSRLMSILSRLASSSRNCKNEIHLLVDIAKTLTSRSLLISLVGCVMAGTRRVFSVPIASQEYEADEQLFAPCQSHFPEDWHGNDQDDKIDYDIRDGIR